ncbi:uncharacterized protein LOC117507376 [Thalassophryne amazonica]|uniref:uncharacterized protein LOC117507376 n=1 Tax=Thalassophryne amazonica TaxID=390379 RepID=UPI001471300B|nr:uncharacterized protein LOC117507376 [Thalassophryne amazonica]XP_034023115.1 uncharacterized protein LOC117507376 [Thalassophryne amazonica]XP_034023117.1 uncharacterized protein LOC117507376 [Thalassophryne amazonica]XP_034023118.1 uncharacterized protein LOC117507376 [Thalassophryne amazonica]
MSISPTPALVPVRDNLPLKKRDPRLSSTQPQCDTATFKVPYPYKSHSGFRTKQTGPFRPIPKRLLPLHHSWTQMHKSTRSKPHYLSAFSVCPEWTDFNPLNTDCYFSHHYQHHSHFSGTNELQMRLSHHLYRFSPVSLFTEGFSGVGRGYCSGTLKASRDKSLNTERRSNGQSKSLHIERNDIKMEHFARLDKSDSVASLCQPDLLHTSTVKPPFSVRGSDGDTTNKADSSTKDVPAGLRVHLSSEHPSSSNSQFPWLIPHFVAGSLIELRDGRLRRVEHLQTEDFLLGSLAYPNLRLSCCTVQSISPSSSSSSISRLLILLHNQQSQESVDVYVEYPFFVRDQGWSSCSPQRTARLCGLQCRQLSVGDVCLALTPLTDQWPSTAKDSPVQPEGWHLPLQQQHPQVSIGTQLSSHPERPAGGYKEAESVRRRHHSAPALKGSGASLML